MERKRTWLRDLQENEEDEEKDRRLSLRERKRVKYIADGNVYEKNEDEDEEQESEEEEKVKHNYVISGLPVICGTKLGLLDVKKLQGGEPCIKCEGQLLTPPAFECLAGKSSTKKWKASIFYNKKPLKFWFEQGYLSTKGYKWGTRALQRKMILPSNSGPKELSNGESDVESSEDSEEEDVEDDDSLSSNEEQAPEMEEKEEGRAEGGKEQAGVNKEHTIGKRGDANLEIWDTDDEDVTDISNNSEDENLIKEEDPRPITSTPGKLGLQKEVKIIIKRLPVTRSDWQTNNTELLRDSSSKSLSESDHNEEMTDDSSVTLDDLFFTSALKNQLPQMPGEARTGGGEEEQEEFRKSTEIQNAKSGIKTEIPSYEEEEDRELKMCCEKENKIRKKEHLDVSISRYNSQLPAAEGGDLASRSGPEQQLITEKIFQPTLSPVSQPLSVLVHHNPTYITEHLQEMTTNMCAPQTSRAPDDAEASSAASSASDEDTRDLHQLKREKIKMQLRVLKLQEEYYILKLNGLKKTKN